MGHNFMNFYAIAGTILLIHCEYKSHSTLCILQESTNKIIIAGFIVGHAAVCTRYVSHFTAVQVGKESLVTFIKYSWTMLECLQSQSDFTVASCDLCCMTCHSHIFHDQVVSHELATFQRLSPTEYLSMYRVRF